jgi:hypothetical protein
MRLASILRRLLPVMERVGVATAAGVEIDGMAGRPCLVCCTMLRANKDLREGSFHEAAGLLRHARQGWKGEGRDGSRWPPEQTPPS